jgi:hypothetical protein
MSAAERKRRQRDREKAQREQAAFAFDRPQEPTHIVTSNVQQHLEAMIAELDAMR